MQDQLLFFSDQNTTMNGLLDIPLSEDESSSIKYAIFDSELPVGWCQLLFEGYSRIFPDDGVVRLLITIQSDGFATQRTIAGTRHMHDILSFEYPQNTSIHKINEWVCCDLMNHRLCWFKS